MTNRSKITSLTTAVAALLLGSIIAPTHGMAAGLDGINYLIAVTQMKANSANDEALKRTANRQQPGPQSRAAGGGGHGKH
jgi:hypothetical protein